MVKPVVFTHSKVAVISFYLDTERLTDIFFESIKEPQSLEWEKVLIYQDV